MRRSAGPRYRSSISKAAIERVIERYPSGAKKRVEYRVGPEAVGTRTFHETGEPEGEWPERSGVRHGLEYRWDEAGVLLSAEPYVDGLPHGVAKQWQEGELIGSYTMVRGTGWDLWWGRRDDGERCLCEARHVVDGHRDGCEWWICDDQRSVYEESHFRRGTPHGIERRWNSEGRLRRGYPKYWVNGTQVPKRAYVAACKRDATLPLFREQDNAPGRRFEAEVAAALGPAQRNRSAPRS